MKNFQSNPLLDQFILIDEKIVEKMVQLLEISKKDIILEIGAGCGTLTRKLMERHPKVTAVEIDKKFAKELNNIPNVKVIIGDALKFLKKMPRKSKVDKIISSLPSSLVEPIFLTLPKINFKIAVFLIPLKFLSKLTNSEKFMNYFKVELIDKVSNLAFFPRPKTNWALIKIIKKDNPLKTGDLFGFIDRYLFEHKNAKPQNALVEALIRFYKSQGKKLTKNQARKFIEEKNVVF